MVLCNRPGCAQGFGGAVWLAAALALGGCAQYTPTPIAPAGVAHAFEARRLDADSVQRYVLARLPRHEGSRITSWDLASLTLAAFYFSPALDVARARAATREAAVGAAAQRPNPVFQFPFEVASHAATGESPYTIGLGLDIPLETAGKRGYRVARARQLSLAARFEVGAAAWQVRSRLREHLLAWHVAQRRTGLLAQQLQARREVVQMLDKRLALGAASAPEVQRAHASLIQDQLTLAEGRQQLADAESAAAADVGIPPDALAQATVRLDAFDRAPPAVPDAAARETALLNRADVQSALADYEASQSALQLAIAQQYPDIHLGPGFTFDMGTRKFALSLSGITLPLFNQNQGAIAQAAAARSEAAARFRQVQAQAIGQVAQAQQSLRTARENLRTAQSLLATQEQAWQAQRQGFDAGDVDRLSLTLARIDLLGARLAALANQQALQQRAGALESALQRPLSEGPAS